MPSNQEHFIAGIIEILHRNKALKAPDSKAMIVAFKGRSDLSFEEFLMHEGLISKDDLLEALSEYYHVPFFDVMGIFFQRHLVDMFPKDVLLRHNFIPYRQDGDVLILIAAEPDDPDLAEVVGMYVSYDVDFLVGYFRDIQDEIEDFYDSPLTEDLQAGDQDIRHEHEEEKDAESLEEIEEKGTGLKFTKRDW